MRQMHSHTTPFHFALPTFFTHTLARVYPSIRWPLGLSAVKYCNYICVWSTDARCGDRFKDRLHARRMLQRRASARGDATGCHSNRGMRRTRSDENGRSPLWQGGIQWSEGLSDGRCTVTSWASWNSSDKVAADKMVIEKSIATSTVLYPCMTCGLYVLYMACMTKEMTNGPYFYPASRSNKMLYVIQYSILHRIGDGSSPL